MNYSIPLILLSLVWALTSIRAQDTAAATRPQTSESEIVNLDAMVVSSGLDDKTAFDLAQGASVLADNELRLRSQSTLGETLSSLPGVNAGYFGPGASRPIIRGLGGDRVRMLANGVGTLDLSNLSPDHTVAVEPLLVERIEVLRGPSTLLYGSSAVGGVVNTIDNSIPSKLASSALEGAVEVRGDTVANQRTGILTALTGTSGFAFRVNALMRDSGDVDIPGYAIQGADAPANQAHGTLPSSELATKTGSFGTAWIGNSGFIGAAVSTYDTAYGVPVGDDPAISIDMTQRRLDLRGEFTQEFGIFSSANLRLGISDYRHSELSGGTTVNTTFKSTSYEGRLELQQVPVGLLTGTVGFQTAWAKVSSVGEEVVQPPNQTTTNAVFILEELKFEHITWQVGARYDNQRIALGEVPELPPFDRYLATSGDTMARDALSGSTGVVVYPLKDYSLGLSLAWSQRLPTAQELFSNGPHGGTGAYEVGDSSLGRETSLGLDLTLRKRAGFITGSIGVFYNRMDAFIYEQELPESAKPEFNNDEDLSVYQFVAADSRFYGGEVELTLHLVDSTNHQLHLNLTGDSVRAELADDANTAIPRIPPLRYGGALRYEGGRWTAGVEIRIAEKQERISSYETMTAGYTLLSANLTYTLPTQRVNYTFFLTGNNLCDEEARIHTSFLKDYAPLPGRNLQLGVRANF
ncbi:MAG: TonB-dependent receptor [Verrucomicrobiota bacterium]|nr:TonB-dependent receptor [Verrucomicrobiota bacterium]